MLFKLNNFLEIFKLNGYLKKIKSEFKYINFHTL